jgi:hypothetical protein
LLWSSRISGNPVQDRQFRPIWVPVYAESREKLREFSHTSPIFWPLDDA